MGIRTAQCEQRGLCRAVGRVLDNVVEHPQTCAQRRCSASMTVLGPVRREGHGLGFYANAKRTLGRAHQGMSAVDQGSDELAREGTLEGGRVSVLVDEKWGVLGEAGGELCGHVLGNCVPVRRCLQLVLLACFKVGRQWRRSEGRGACGRQQGCGCNRSGGEAFLH